MGRPVDTLHTPLQHTTVLLTEAIDALFTQPDGHYIDATFGRGGHTRELLARLSQHGRVTVFDKDPQAIAAAHALADSRLTIRHEGFTHMGQLPNAQFAGILMDLGVSSPQVDDASRGFSFRNDGPLDMRMDPTRGQSVAQWLATVDVDQMAQIIRDYGEERFASQIAKAIEAQRASGQRLSTTAELAQLVARTVKTREPGKDPATRTFQAFRIFINAELDELRHALQASVGLLQTGGRLVVISFHSLEDRIAKRFIVEHARDEVDRKNLFAPPKTLPLKSVGRVMPSEAEVKANARARSAVMRVAERTAAAWSTVT